MRISERRLRRKIREALLREASDTTKQNWLLKIKRKFFKEYDNNPGNMDAALGVAAAILRSDRAIRKFTEAERDALYMALIQSPDFPRPLPDTDDPDAFSDIPDSLEDVTPAPREAVEDVIVQLAAEEAGSSEPPAEGSDAVIAQTPTAATNVYTVQADPPFTINQRDDERRGGDIAKMQQVAGAPSSNPPRGGGSGTKTGDGYWGPNTDDAIRAAFPPFMNDNIIDADEFGNIMTMWEDLYGEEADDEADDEAVETAQVAHGKWERYDPDPSDPSKIYWYAEDVKIEDRDDPVDVAVYPEMDGNAVAVVEDDRSLTAALTNRLDDVWLPDGSTWYDVLQGEGARTSGIPTSGWNLSDEGNAFSITHGDTVFIVDENNQVFKYPADAGPNEMSQIDMSDYDIPSFDELSATLRGDVVDLPDSDSDEYMDLVVDASELAAQPNSVPVGSTMSPSTSDDLYPLITWTRNDQDGAARWVTRDDLTMWITDERGSLDLFSDPSGAGRRVDMLVVRQDGMWRYRDAAHFATGISQTGSSWSTWYSEDSNFKIAKQGDGFSAADSVPPFSELQDVYWLQDSSLRDIVAQQAGGLSVAAEEPDNLQERLSRSSLRSMILREILKRRG